jgi:hypothetical protein
MAEKKIEKPKPRTFDPIDSAFWQNCQDGTLRFQRCSACDAWRFLPRYICANCGSADYEWSPSSGKGHVFSWTVTHQALHPAFADEVPFVAAIIELEEGVRMATRLVDCAPETVALDMPVEITFERIADDFLLPCFRPSDLDSQSHG